MNEVKVVPLVLDEIEALGADALRGLFPQGTGIGRVLLTSLEMTTTPDCVVRGGGKNGETFEKVSSL